MSVVVPLIISDMSRQIGCNSWIYCFLSAPILHLKLLEICIIIDGSTAVDPAWRIYLTEHSLYVSFRYCLLPLYALLILDYLYLLRVSCSQQLSNRASPIALSGCNGWFLDLGTLEVVRLHASNFNLMTLRILEKVIVVVKSLSRRKLFASLEVGRDSCR